MDEDFIVKTCEKMRSNQKRKGLRANGEWIFYCVDHYGGSEIAINRPDDALCIHKQDYDYYYKQVPNQVHWQSLQEKDGNTHHDSYMTAPVVWHSYFQFCGYMIDNAFNRLWIRPRIPSEMNGKIRNAILLNPKCHGTLNYEENINDSCTQKMTISYDDPGVTIKEIILKNNTNVNNPFVYIDGDGSHSLTTSGTGLGKKITIKLNTPVLIKQNELRLEVYDKPCSNCGKTSIKDRTIKNTIPSAVKSSFLAANKPVHYSVSTSGMISIELLRVNGARIGTIFQKRVTEGCHNFIWNGKTLKGSPAGFGFAVLRLVTPAGSVVKPVVLVCCFL
jgi:hypothetical protein